MVATLAELDTDVKDRQLRAQKVHSPPDSLEPRGWPSAEGGMGTPEGRERRGGIIRGGIYLSRTLPIHANGYA